MPSPGVSCSSQHFRVFYLEDAAFAAAVAEWGEHYYTQITLDLGLQHVVKRDWAPWLWERRCRIYLYPTREAYLRATRAPQWSGAWCTTASVWFTVFWERQRFSTKPCRMNWRTLCFENSWVLTTPGCRAG